MPYRPLLAIRPWVFVFICSVAYTVSDSQSNHHSVILIVAFSLCVVGCFVICCFCSTRFISTLSIADVTDYQFQVSCP